MANLKAIRKRISSVKSTQKITRAMKMVAGARLNRAQQRILALRPYAVKTGHVLAEVTAAANRRLEEGGGSGVDADHPLLARRAENNVLILVITSDRGLCGAFNTNILRLAERQWREREAQGQKVQIAVIGRKGRDYFKRRNAPVMHVFSGIWDRLDLEQARTVARVVLKPFLSGEVDAILLVYNEFKSAMTQRVVCEPLFPLPITEVEEAAEPALEREFIFEPNKEALLERLVPMYVEISVLRSLLESMASELGARMTAMDSATKNAAEMIDRLTLSYNRARQAAITTELMEIIGGAEALKG
ncbi:MAG: ATP synthase F1 subunit gamma [Polyangiaceae bacterium]|nr:ATP synthase F1 subunit gamma [Polyangiaceae bacterium]MCE7891342.1 ATP synthase F1 subunit gamma [Sorangiineae bacterium PRO1]MCL4750394.1 ATP synthase F1 subunit gamma [Myxococcales bacterium]